MASIYNIQTWSSSTEYSKNDIVSHKILDVLPKYFFYSLIEKNKAHTPDIDSNSWGGLVSFNSIVKPAFIWTPSYNSSISTDPLVRSVRFGDGYEQRIKEGLNNSLIKIELTFEKRSLKEMTAMVHFLEKRAGAESFIFPVPEPYNIRKLFVARSWTSDQAFVNNYSLRTSFEEVPF